MEIDSKILFNLSVELLFYDEKINKRKIVQFKADTVQEIELESLFPTNIQKCDMNTLHRDLPIIPLSASAFVDIDADCQNDLMIVSALNKSTNVLEIWRGYKENQEIKYCLTANSVDELDKSLGHFTVADINRDGLLDLVFPIVDTDSVLISFNKLDLKFDWSADYCAHQLLMKREEYSDIFDKINLNPSEKSVSTTYLSFSSLQKFPLDQNRVINYSLIQTNHQL